MILSNKQEYIKHIINVTENPYKHIIWISIIYPYKHIISI